MKPQLILVNGIPGTGKTTLSRRLGKDLGLPVLGKDDFKEFLFDHLGTGDANWSKVLGKLSANVIFMIIDDLLATDKQFIIESAFWKDFAAPEIKACLDRHNAGCIELHCVTDTPERVRRFTERNETVGRHPGHVDTAIYEKLLKPEWIAQYDPLGLGPCITVDTTRFGDQEYSQLLVRLKPYIMARPPV